MSTKAQIKTQARTPAAPAAARIPQPPVAEQEHEAERPDIAAQLEGAARLGHSLGAVGGGSAAPTTIQRQEIPEEEEEELQMKREPAAIQRQGLPEEEEEGSRRKPEEGRVGPHGGQAPPEVEAAIRRARGGGQPLEGGLQEQMSASMGHDFSGVRVHTDAVADQLNHKLQAKAFTIGSEVFFRHGEYNPSREGSRELIAHELTHVVQQTTGSVPRAQLGLIVRPSDDAFELEAKHGERGRPECYEKVDGGGAERAPAKPLSSSPAALESLQNSLGGGEKRRTANASTEGVKRLPGAVGVPKSTRRPGEGKREGAGGTYEDRVAGARSNRAVVQRQLRGAKLRRLHEYLTEAGQPELREEPPTPEARRSELLTQGRQYIKVAWAKTHAMQPRWWSMGRAPGLEERPGARMQAGREQSDPITISRSYIEELLAQPRATRFGLLKEGIAHEIRHYWQRRGWRGLFRFPRATVDEANAAMQDFDAKVRSGEIGPRDIPGTLRTYFTTAHEADAYRINAAIRVLRRRGDEQMGAPISEEQIREQLAIILQEAIDYWIGVYRRLHPKGEMPRVLPQASFALGPQPGAGRPHPAFVTIPGRFRVEAASLEETKEGEAHGGI